MSYQAGKPIISDAEFDELKGTLRKKNSKVVQQVPLSPRMASQEASLIPARPRSLASEEAALSGHAPKHSQKEHINT